MQNQAKKILQISGILIFFLLIIIYGFFRSQDLIFGVKIKNVNIADETPARTTVQSGGKVLNNILEITGNAKNAISLTLDGREISIDGNGNFDETIALLPGYNIINIKAQDKFGYTDEKNYKLMY